MSQYAIDSISTYYDRLQISYDKCISVLTHNLDLTQYMTDKQTCLEFIDFWSQNATNPIADFWANNRDLLSEWKCKMRYFYDPAEAERFDAVYEDYYGKLPD